jgi:hypothetical protein
MATLESKTAHVGGDDLDTLEGLTAAGAKMYAAVLGKDQLSDAEMAQVRENAAEAYADKNA